jgi:spoIIIJ-associated protein
MAEIEVEGKTVEEAINEGLKKLNTSRDNVEVKILNEGTTGLFGLMGTKPARVLLITKEGSATRLASSVDTGTAQARVKQIVGDLLKLMNFSCKEVTTTVNDDRITAAIVSDEGSLLIGKGGQTLESLEHVVNLILNKDEHTRMKVTLDTEQYRQRQEERLQQMAQKAADQVRSTGRTYRFDPMPAKERRLIHVLLKDDPEVETFSEGEGAFRKVGIKAKKK